MRERVVHQFWGLGWVWQRYWPLFALTAQQLVTHLWLCVWLSDNHKESHIWAKNNATVRQLVEYTSKSGWKWERTRIRGWVVGASKTVYGVWTEERRGWCLLRGVMCARSITVHWSEGSTCVLYGFNICARCANQHPHTQCTAQTDDNNTVCVPFFIKLAQQHYYKNKPSSRSPTHTCVQ